MVKLEIFIPSDYVERLRDELHAVGVGQIGAYDHCLSITNVRGYWRPLEGAIPFQGRVGEISFQGRVGEISEGTECKVEAQCHRRYVTEALSAIRRVHPYDEPVVNVIPLVNHLF